jgi:hypothetical protein
MTRSPLNDAQMEWDRSAWHVVLILVVCLAALVWGLSLSATPVPTAGHTPRPAAVVVPGRR